MLDYLEGNNISAKENLSKALSIWPDNLATMEFLVTVYGEIGDWAELEELITRIIVASDDDTSMLRVIRGLARLNQLEFQSAKDDFIHVLEIDPDNYLALYGLGCIYILPEGNSLEAIKVFNQLESVNPEFSDLYLMRGLAHYLVGYTNKAERDCYIFNEKKNVWQHISPTSSCSIVDTQEIKGYAISYLDGLTTVYVP